MRRGFTLIEVLVVVGIVLLLTAMIIGAAGPLMQQARRQRSGAIIQALAAALAQSASTGGGRIEPAEHPLAGSKEPRPAFVRAADGSSVSTAGEALRGVAADQLADAGAAPRLLLPDDRYAETAVPLLYGLDRARIGILGAPRAEVTAYRRLALGRGQTSVPSTSGFVVATTAGTSDHDRAVQSLIGEGALSELMGLGAVYAPAADTDLAWQDRVVREPLATSSRRPLSRFRDPADGAWKTYRIRGLGLYDAWGRELLLSLVRAGEYRIGSAGADGCFVWHPGGDDLYQTAPAASSPTGDDRDASRDNLWHPQP